MKLLSKIGEYVTMAIGFPVCVAVSLASLCALGLLVLLLPAWIVSLFSEHLADSLNHVLLPDWPLHLGLVIPLVVGCLTILCGSRISHAWERRRAVEKEIQPVLDIQIVEPPAPGPVERFFGKDGPADRLFDRCFGWIENVENDLARYVLGFIAWTAVAFPLGGVAMWLQSAQIRPLKQWEAIPVAFLYGSVLNVLILSALAGLEWAARNVRTMRTLMEGNLPRKLILPYRSWQLRRIARNRWPRDPLRWLLTLLAIALLTLAAVGAWQLLTHARGEEDKTEDVQQDY